MQTRSLTDQRWGDPCELDGGGVEFGVRLIVDVACGVCDVSVIACEMCEGDNNDDGGGWWCGL